jgi:hypothetical protein
MKIARADESCQARSNPDKPIINPSLHFFGKFEGYLYWKAPHVMHIPAPKKLELPQHNESFLLLVRMMTRKEEMLRWIRR